MATTITLSYDDKEYVLEFNRNSVKQMEQNGFVLSQLSDKPLTMVPLLVYGAFAKNHKNVKRALMDEIYEHVTDKIGDGEGFIETLVEMYAETVNTLTDNASVDEGNAAVWKVTRG